MTELPTDADPAAVEAAWRGAIQHGERALVEHVVGGPEVSVETVSAEGIVTVLAITDKLTTGAPEHVEIGHSQPSSLPRFVQEQIVDIATSTVEAIGLRTGIAHTEIRVDPVHGPKVIEVGARAGGGFIMSDLLPLTTGVDAVDLTLDLALGVPTSPRPESLGAAAVRFIESNAGRVVEVLGDQAARSLAGVVTVQVGAGPGQQIAPLRDARDRIGHVVAVAAEPGLAMVRANRAVALIDVRVTTCAPASEAAPR